MELTIGLSITNFGGGVGGLIPPPSGANELSDTFGTPNILTDTFGTPNELTDTEI